MKSKFSMDKPPVNPNIIHNSVMISMMSHFTLDEMLALIKPYNDGEKASLTEENVRMELISRYDLPFTIELEDCIKHSVIHTPSLECLKHMDPSVVFEEAIDTGDTHLMMGILNLHPEVVITLGNGMMEAPAVVIEKAMDLHPECFSHMSYRSDASDDVIRLFHMKVAVCTTLTAADYIFHGKYDIAMEMCPTFWEEMKDDNIEWRGSIVDLCIRSADVSVVKKLIEIVGEIMDTPFWNIGTAVWNSSSVEMLEFFYPEGQHIRSLFSESLSPLPPGEKGMSFFREVIHKLTTDTIESVGSLMVVNDHIEALEWLMGGHNFDMMGSMYESVVHGAEKCFKYLWSLASNDDKDSVISYTMEVFEEGYGFSPNLYIYTELIAHSQEIKKILVYICAEDVKHLPILKALEPSAEDLKGCYSNISLHGLKTIRLLEYMSDILPPNDDEIISIMEYYKSPIVEDILRKKR